MEKTITVRIPNEIWVNDFSENKTAPFTYSGPNKIWITVSEDNTVSSYSESEPAVSTGKLQVEVDIATASEDQLQAAIVLVGNASEHTYQYAPETNHDGSIYQKIVNPKLGDYYTLRYSPAAGFELVQIVKDTTVATEAVARERKAYVEKYSTTYDFSPEITQAITNYLTSLDNYLASVETAYPWKYVQIDKNEVPKIPVSLVQVFNTLPVIS